MTSSKKGFFVIGRIKSSLERRLVIILFVFVGSIAAIIFFKDGLIEQAYDPYVEASLRAWLETVLIVAAATVGAIVGFDLQQHYGNKKRKDAT